MVERIGFLFIAMTTPTNLEPDRLWQMALVELQLQMTKATFETWVKPTFALSLQGNVLKVGVRNAYAQSWLSNRLINMIERVLAMCAQKELKVEFILKPREEAVETAKSTEGRDSADTSDPVEDAKPGDVIVEVLKNPLEPYLRIQKYAIWFWQPLIGHTAFATWVMLRTKDRVNDGIGKKNRVSVELLADTLKVHRQEITGVMRERGKRWQKGAFDVLNDYGIARIEPIGKGAKAIWYAKVMNSLPLLTPHQVQQLTPLLQERQQGFLEIFKFDFENWEQLTMDSLVQGFE